MVDNPPIVNPVRICMQGITNEKVDINQLTFKNFIPGIPQKNLILEFEGLIGSDFLKYYNGIVDIKKTTAIKFQDLLLIHDG